jgi:hypothetical protein
VSGVSEGVGERGIRIVGGVLDVMWCGILWCGWVHGVHVVMGARGIFIT